MIELRRIDPAQNMRRFYRLDIQPDLFGGFLLLKQWGRIGAHGQIKAERYDNEAPALAALHQQAAKKTVRLCLRGKNAAGLDTLTNERRGSVSAGILI
jgi:predicted DNA-binding WGR domain protein